MVLGIFTLHCFAAAVKLHFAFQPVKRNHHFHLSSLHRQVWKHFSSFFRKKSSLSSTVTHQCVHPGLCTVLYSFCWCLWSVSTVLELPVCVYMYLCFAFVWWAAACGWKVWFFSWSLFLSFACFVSMLAAREEGNVVCLVGLQAKSKVVT